jgi:hypothetical protein
MLAVFHRSSLGVAGILAAERFHINATSLATFTVGDAMIFVSVIRIVSIWFLVRQAPMITQLTGLTGQLGAIAAAAPLTLLLDRLGWTRAFATVSSLGVVLLVAVVFLVKDSPYRSDEVVTIKLRALAQSVRTVWGNPGTRLGMWSHFTSQFSGTVFALLWGFPFLVRGLGWSETAAAGLLMAMTAWAVASGLLLARLVARVPLYRSWIVIGVVLNMAAAWAAVLLWPGVAPGWLVVVMAFATATGGPASMVGFDLARTFTPVQAIGRANGLVNVGGFTASLLTMALIGIVLDLAEPGGMEAYALDDYRLAMAVQFPFWIFGIVQILRYRRRGLDHLRRVHPGAVEEMRAGRPFVHPGIGTEGV